MAANHGHALGPVLRRHHTDVRARAGLRQGDEDEGFLREPLAPPERQHIRHVGRLLAPLQEAWLIWHVDLAAGHRSGRTFRCGLCFLLRVDQAWEGQHSRDHCRRICASHRVLGDSLPGREDDRRGTGRRHTRRRSDAGIHTTPPGTTETGTGRTRCSE